MNCMIEDCPQPVVTTIARCYYHDKEAKGLFDSHDRVEFSPESDGYDAGWRSAPRLQEEYVRHEITETTRLSTFVDLMEAEWTPARGL